MDMFYCKTWPCDILIKYQLDIVGCPVVIAAAIPDAMLLPTDECLAHEVSEPVYDGLTCPKYALWDSNPGLLLARSIGQTSAAFCFM
jgi:hypothetical protein